MLTKHGYGVIDIADCAGEALAQLKNTSSVAYITPERYSAIFITGKNPHLNCSACCHQDPPFMQALCNPLTLSDSEEA